MRRHHLPESASEHGNSDHNAAAGKGHHPGLIFPEYDFPSGAEVIRKRLEGFNPLRYDQSRNYLNGHLSYLSPYISRGYFTLPFLKAYILQRYEKKQCYRFIYELAWREYFQRVWMEKGDAIFNSIRQEQQDVESDEIPAAVVNAETGIESIDAAIRKLYETGYMHNHFRMYIAAIVCNVARTKWQTGAAWMYKHLLDADPASNYLSWQWVAGTFSSKKYYCNQENINRYSGSRQRGTFLDVPYEAFPGMKIPEVLKERCPLSEPVLKDNDAVNLQVAPENTILLYTPFHMDPEWRKGEAGLRILCLHDYGKGPALGRNTIRFIQELASNIPGIQILKCSTEDLLRLYPNANLLTREHPSLKDINGLTKNKQEPMFPEISGSYHSFSAFWKKAEALFLKD
jgi:deoxyribodipyrimidine photo-lyase